MIDRSVLFLRKYGYWLVLSLTAMSYVLCAAQEGSHPNPLAFVAQLATVAVALWIAEVPERLLRLCWLVLGGAVAAVIVAELVGARGHVLDVVLSGASVLACLITPAAIVAHRMRVRRSGMQNLLAAVTAYVTVGMMFAFVYNLCALLSVSPVLSGEAGDSLRGQLFFSFTTLTTLGYGNVVPLGAVIETIAVAEAITGQLFIITAVASIVTAQWANPRNNRAEEQDS